MKRVFSSALALLCLFLTVCAVASAQTEIFLDHTDQVTLVTPSEFFVIDGLGGIISVSDAVSDADSTLLISGSVAVSIEDTATIELAESGGNGSFTPIANGGQPDSVMGAIVVLSSNETANRGNPDCVFRDGTAANGSETGHGGNSECATARAAATSGRPITILTTFKHPACCLDIACWNTGAPPALAIRNAGTDMKKLS
jgi:hypothetical protein